MDLDAIHAEESSRSRRGGPMCWVCVLPEREWLEQKRREGTTYPVLLSVLLRAGHPDATIHRLRGHFQNHV